MQRPLVLVCVFESWSIMSDRWLYSIKLILEACWLEGVFHIDAIISLIYMYIIFLFILKKHWSMLTKFIYWWVFFCVVLKVCRSCFNCKNILFKWCFKWRYNLYYSNMMIKKNMRVNFRWSCIKPIFYLQILFKMF